MAEIAFDSKENSQTSHEAQLNVQWESAAGGQQKVAHDIGLNAEEVAEVEPLLITRNEKGEVEDLKENSLDVVFINAFKEQQKQLEAQQELIRLQQKQIDALKKLVCSTNSQADFCKEEK